MINSVASLLAAKIISCEAPSHIGGGDKHHPGKGIFRAIAQRVQDMGFQCFETSDIVNIAWSFATCDQFSTAHQPAATQSFLRALCKHFSSQMLSGETTADQIRLMAWTMVMPIYICVCFEFDILQKSISEDVVLSCLVCLLFSFVLFSILFCIVFFLFLAFALYVVKCRILFRNKLPGDQRTFDVVYSSHVFGLSRPSCRFKDPQH